MTTECRLTIICRPDTYEEQVTTFPTQFHTFHDEMVKALVPGGKIELAAETTQVRFVVEKVRTQEKPSDPS